VFGLTTTAVPVKLPGIHVYVSAPFAVNVVELPMQILVEPLIVIIGSGITVTVKVNVLVQPGDVVQVTV